MPILLLHAGCGDGDGDALPSSGELLAMTYNVAGLPEGLSGSHPKVNTPLISPLLNGYELVLVQEDFWYHAPLSADAEHAHRSEPSREVPDWLDMGDGLNRFSDSAITEFTRVPWIECFGTTDNGSDCATPKGFSAALHELGPGAKVLIYNLHMDASGDEGSQQARQAQVEQLIGDIEARAGAAALIVAGDTNLKQWKTERALDGPVLERLLAGAGLSDACRHVGCPEETHDRILFRASDDLALEAVSWSRPTEFKDGAGEDLSDHVPVVVRLEWRALR